MNPFSGAVANRFISVVLYLLFSLTRWLQLFDQVPDHAHLLSGGWTHVLVLQQLEKQTQLLHQVLHTCTEIQEKDRISDQKHVCRRWQMANFWTLSHLYTWDGLNAHATFSLIWLKTFLCIYFLRMLLGVTGHFHSVHLTFLKSVMRPQLLDIWFLWLFMEETLPKCQTWYPEGLMQ